MQSALAGGSPAVEHSITHLHGGPPHDSAAAADADVARTLQAEKTGEQDVQSNQDGLLRARQSTEHQPGLPCSSLLFLQVLQ